MLTYDVNNVHSWFEVWFDELSMEARVIQKAKQMLIEKLEDPENYQIVFEEPYIEPHINSVIGKLWAIRNPNV